MPTYFFLTNRCCLYIYPFTSFGSFFVSRALLTYWRRWMFVIHHVAAPRLSSLSFKLTCVLWDSFLIARISEHYDRKLSVQKTMRTNPLGIKKNLKNILGPVLYRMTLMCSYDNELPWMISPEIISNKLFLLMNKNRIDIISFYLSEMIAQVTRHHNLKK